MEACSTVRNPAADAPYLEKIEKRVSRTLNRNKNVPTERTVKPSRKNNTRRNNMASTAATTEKAVPVNKPYLEIEGDILKMPTGKDKYIVQQCSCIALNPAGLSKAIADKWPSLNPYAGRETESELDKVPTFETRDVYGSAKVFHDKKNNVNMVCLYAQYKPGKPPTKKGGIYEDAYVEPLVDSAERRLDRFKTALTKLTKPNKTTGEVLIPPGSTLYIPHGIGCGLAGGNWTDYEAALREFSEKNPTYKVRIVKLPSTTASKKN